MISRQWWPACKALTQWWWRRNESLCSWARGSERCYLCEWSWHLLFIQLHWIINKKKVTEGLGCCVTAIFSSFQFTTTHTDALCYPGLTSEWHNILCRSLMGVCTRPPTHKSKWNETHSYTQPISTNPELSAEIHKPVEIHELSFFTKMSHKLQRATVIAMFANILPCGSVLGFFSDSDSAWKVLSARMPVAPRPGFTEKTASLKHPAWVLLILKANLRSIHRPCWITGTNTIVVCSSIIFISNIFM